MKTRLHVGLLSVAVALTVVSLALSQEPAPGQGKGKAGQGKGKGGGRGGPVAPTGPTPRMPDGKPDLSGLWFRPYTPNMASGPAKDTRQGDPTGPKEIPYTAAFKKDWDSYDPKDGDYTGACLPFGLMRSMNSPDPIQFMQHGDFMALLYEQNTWFKLIPIDGRPHPAGATSTWFGDSVGHWDGDTLVVNTNNFNGRTRLDTAGHPHSDALETTEKFTRTDLGHMSYEVMLHDPKAFTEDWGNKRTFTLRTDTQIMEYSCEENNKSLWEGRIKVPKYDQ
ncbi:MAG TPA: hypothetical protein VGJ09_14310 [Bryobacteraceae bacterium]